MLLEARASVPRGKGILIFSVCLHQRDDWLGSHLSLCLSVRTCFGLGIRLICYYYVNVSPVGVVLPCWF